MSTGSAGTAAGSPERASPCCSPPKAGRPPRPCWPRCNPRQATARRRSAATSPHARRTVRCSRSTCAWPGSARIVSRSPGAISPRSNNPNATSPAPGPMRSGPATASPNYWPSCLTRSARRSMPSSDFAEIMMDERFGTLGNPRYKDYLKDIHTSGTQVMNVVNDLLDLSRIEAGRHELDLGAVDINRVIAECVAQIQTEAHRGRVIVRTSFSPRQPMVMADDRATRQIISNLLSNAVKFQRARRPGHRLDHDGRDRSRAGAHTGHRHRHVGPGHRVRAGAVPAIRTVETGGGDGSRLAAHQGARRCQRRVAVDPQPTRRGNHGGGDVPARRHAGARPRLTPRPLSSHPRQSSGMVRPECFRRRGHAEAWLRFRNRPAGAARRECSNPPGR